MQPLAGKQFSFWTESLLETLWINSTSQKNNRPFCSCVSFSAERLIYVSDEAQKRPRWCEDDSLESPSNRLQKCADSEYQPASLD